LIVTVAGNKLVRNSRRFLVRYGTTIPFKDLDYTTKRNVQFEQEGVDTRNSIKMKHYNKVREALSFMAMMSQASKGADTQAKTTLAAFLKETS